jgi:hypothetical protein
MNSSDKIFEPEKYTYAQYKLWEGDWELIKGFPHAMSLSAKKSITDFLANFIVWLEICWMRTILNVIVKYFMK